MNKQAFEEGRTAYFNGETRKDNPYDTYSEAYTQWLKGFKTGEKEDMDHDPNGN
jgi:ribosome modulation factor